LSKIAKALDKKGRVWVLKTGCVKLLTNQQPVTVE
jgi:hypothetical protein